MATNTLTIDVTVDFSHVDWTDPANPKGAVQWTVSPTRLVVDPGTNLIKWNLQTKNLTSHRHTKLAFDATAGIAFKTTWSGAAPGRVSDSQWSAEDDFTANDPSDTGYTITVVLTSDSLANGVSLTYDPDVENESPDSPTSGGTTPL